MARISACLEDTRWCSTIASAICLPIGITGFNDVIGSWKIMPIRPPRTRTQRALRSTDQLDAVELHRPGGGCVGVEQTECGEHGGALARPGLADDRRHFTAVDGEVDAAHRMDLTGAHREAHMEVAHLEQRLVTHRCARTSKWSRRPSPMKLNAMPSVRIARPGATPIHHW